MLVDTTGVIGLQWTSRITFTNIIRLHQEIVSPEVRKYLKKYFESLSQEGDSEKPDNLTPVDWLGAL